MKQKLLGIFTLAWVGLFSYFISQAHSWHQLAFKADTNKIELGLEHLQSSKDLKQNNIVHFLTPSCSCSRVIKEDLLKREPYQDTKTSESVVLIDDLGGHFAKKLKVRGYTVISMSLAQIKSEMPAAIEAVPLLVIYDGDKHLQYAGGYDQSTITPLTNIDVKKILGQVRAESKTRTNKKEAYPVKGCAVSKKYQNLLDPMGIKYATVN